MNVLRELKDSLDEVGVYEWHEVEQFAILYFGNADAEQLSPIIDAAAARFNVELALEDEAKADFKIKAKQFVKIYGQMASIIPFEIVDWEKRKNTRIIRIPRIGCWPLKKSSRKSCSRTAGPRWNSINCWPMMRRSRPPCSKACKEWLDYSAA
ncbi:hypothetical protein [Desulfosarcina ovata]|uniref:hypothetical protein n=1 Tax=Desulfosarcina ovata TaxID=83564 RepID=UPI0018D7F4D7|nr:hypothetical protein [Desulfosarcina ovata]